VVTRRAYVPDAGDIVRLHFDAPAGDHEPAQDHSGHRPALVLSLASYNDRTGMIVCCPITTRIKGYPFEVAIAGAPPSVVLADQLNSQDWRARKATRKGKVTAEELAEVRAKLIAIIG
jgi:mRNA interferase MazF